MNERRHRRPAWQASLLVPVGSGFCYRGLLLTGVALMWAGLACNNGATSGNDNTLLTDALGFEGSLSGKVSDSQSTRESIDGGNTGQSVPPGFDTARARIHFPKRCER